MSLEPPPLGTPFPAGMVTGPWMRWIRALALAVRSLQAQGGTALTVAWDAITGKPSTFPPSTHTHSQYITDETDPVFRASVAGSIQQSDVNRWNAPETDPTVPNHIKSMTAGAVTIAENLAASYASGAIDATGWEDPAGIGVSWDSGARTVTLTHASSALVYLYKGIRYTLASPWTSTAHPTGDGGFFLYSTDGTTLAWSTTSWAFRDVLVAFVRVDSVGSLTMCIREVHGSVMDSETHDELHNNIGTWIKSGGTLAAGTYAIASAVDADITPGVDATTVKDEDLPSTLAALPQGTYQRVYVTGGVAYTASASFPFTSAGSYLQWYNAGTLTTGATGKFYNVWGVAVPAAADATSQAKRWLWFQPQAEHGTLAAALAESFSTLDLGNIATILTEFCPRIQIIYSASAANGNTGKCTIAAVKTLTKAKVLAI